MKKVFFENSRGERRLIAKVDTLRECRAAIQKFLADHNYKAPYWRVWESAANEAQFDVGSYSEFFFVTPCSEEELERN